MNQYRILLFVFGVLLQLTISNSAGNHCSSQLQILYFGRHSMRSERQNYFQIEIPPNTVSVKFLFQTNDTSSFDYFEGHIRKGGMVTPANSQYTFFLNQWKKGFTVIKNATSASDTNTFLAREDAFPRNQTDSPGLFELEHPAPGRYYVGVFLGRMPGALGWSPPNPIYRLTAYATYCSRKCMGDSCELPIDPLTAFSFSFSDSLRKTQYLLDPKWAPTRSQSINIAFSSPQNKTALVKQNPLPPLVFPRIKATPTSFASSTASKTASSLPSPTSKPTLSNGIVNSQISPPPRSAPLFPAQNKHPHGSRPVFTPQSHASPTWPSTASAAALLEYSTHFGTNTVTLQMFFPELCNASSFFSQNASVLTLCLRYGAFPSPTTADYCVSVQKGALLANQYAPSFQLEWQYSSLNKSFSAVGESANFTLPGSASGAGAAASWENCLFSLQINAPKGGQWFVLAVDETALATDPLRGMGLLGNSSISLQSDECPSTSTGPYCQSIRDLDYQNLKGRLKQNYYAPQLLYERQLTGETSWYRLMMHDLTIPHSVVQYSLDFPYPTDDCALPTPSVYFRHQATPTPSCYDHVLPAAFKDNCIGSVEIELPYLEEGVWFIAIQSNFNHRNGTHSSPSSTLLPSLTSNYSEQEWNILESNGSKTYFQSIALTGCENACSHHGSCGYGRAGGLFMYSCRCDGLNIYSGLTCEIQHFSYFVQVVYVMCLVLSNLAMIPVIRHTLRRQLYVESGIFALNMVVSAVYHQCDSDFVCLGGLEYGVLMTFDFFCAFLSSLVTFAFVVGITTHHKVGVYVSSTITAFYLSIGDKTSEINFIVIGLIGAVMFGYQSLTRVKPSEDKDAQWEFVLPDLNYKSFFVGVGFLATAMILTMFVTTSGTYWLIHSLWHCTVMLSIFFFIRATLKRENPPDPPDVPTSAEEGPKVEITPSPVFAQPQPSSSPFGLSHSHTYHKKRLHQHRPKPLKRPSSPLPLSMLALVSPQHKGYAALRDDDPDSALTLPPQEGIATATEWGNAKNAAKTARGWEGKVEHQNHTETEIDGKEPTREEENNSCGDNRTNEEIILNV